MLTDEKKKMTLEEFMKLPYERAELINGIAYINEPAPSYGHQRSVADIAAQIFLHLTKAHNGEVLLAPMDVTLGEVVVQPDLLFIDNTNLGIISEQGLHGAPDVTFEIISPTSVYRDTKEKFDLYEQYGVKEYFIVFPEDKTVFKYSLINNEYEEQYKAQGFINSEVIGLEFNF
ncbi:MAG: Uma2 family endonuclease [Chitinophagales bacterium]|nr:Uma2 family endonuclease [Chitinophagales bacterium]